MNKMKRVPLYGGPHDGEEHEILEDNLKIFPILNMTDEQGNDTSYQYTEKGKFVWIKDPDNHVPRGFICDDDGNVICELNSPEEALEKLDEFNDESNKWKYE